MFYNSYPIIGGSPPTGFVVPNGFGIPGRNMSWVVLSVVIAVEDVDCVVVLVGVVAAVVVTLLI